MKFKIIYILLLLCYSTATAKVQIKTLPSLAYGKNPILKSIKKDIRRTVYTIRSNREVHNLPVLKFYKYRVKKGDTFWKIISRSSLDIDTLMSINNLTHPGAVRKGRIIFIPNMRGIIVKGRQINEIKRQIKLNNIHPAYILKVNRSKNLNKKFIFIPCGKVSSIERSLFMGTGFLFPLVKGIKTSGFGSRRNPFNGKSYEFHKGIDLACSVGSKVFAARKGTVIFKGYKGGYGKLIIIEHEYGYRTYYGHLSQYKVKIGQVIKAGVTIALSGNTGRTTGPHLHFEVRKRNRSVNPGRLIKLKYHRHR